MSKTKSNERGSCLVSVFLGVESQTRISLDSIGSSRRYGRDGDEDMDSSFLVPVLI